MKYDLDVLENGFAICRIKVATDTSKKICFDAVINTGIVRSIICKTIYNYFKEGIPPVEYDFAITFPKDNWVKPEIHKFLIMDLTDNVSYKAIIGIDLLQVFGLSFIYNGSNGLAWLQG